MQRGKQSVKERRQASDDRKRELLALYREREEKRRAAKTASSPAKQDERPTHTRTSTTAPVKALRHERDKLAGRLKRSQEVTAALRDEVRALKLELAGVKRERHELRQAWREAQADADRLAEALAVSRAAERSLRADMEHLQKEPLLDELRAMRADASMQRSAIARLRQKNLRLAETVTRLKRETEIERAIHYETMTTENNRLAERNRQLGAELQALKVKLEEAEGNYRALQEDQDLALLVRVLEAGLTYRSLEAYAGVPELGHRVKRMRVHLARQSRKRKPQAPPETAELLHGILMEKDGRYLFIDLDGNAYPVNGDPLTLMPDAPAAAWVDGDGWAHVQKVHDNEVGDERVPAVGKVPSPAGKRRPGHRRRAWDEFEAEFDGVRILVVGSRHLSLYKEALEHGKAVVETHNPFEESADVLTGKLSRAQLVLLCAAHIPHRVHGQIDVRSAKVELIRRDSPLTLLTRARYALVRLEEASRLGG